MPEGLNNAGLVVAPFGRIRGLSGFRLRPHRKRLKFTGKRQTRHTQPQHTRATTH